MLIRKYRKEQDDAEKKIRAQQDAAKTKKTDQEKLAEFERKIKVQEDDEKDILCVQIAGLCHDLGKLLCTGLIIIITGIRMHLFIYRSWSIFTSI